MDKHTNNPTEAPLGFIALPFSYEIHKKAPDGNPYTTWIRYATEAGTTSSFSRGCARRVKSVVSHLFEECELSLGNSVPQDCLFAAMIALDPVSRQDIARHYYKFGADRPLTKHVTEDLFKVLVSSDLNVNNLYPPLMDIITKKLDTLIGFAPEDYDAIKMAVNNLLKRLAVNLMLKRVHGNPYIRWVF